MKIIPILVAMLPAFCSAGTLTVDPQNGGNGNFATISQAADRAGPGDTVVVRAGTYRENVRLKRSGTRDRPIRFVADKPGSVVITGADVIEHFQRVDGDEPIYRVAWPHVFAIDQRDGKAVEYHPEN